MTEAAEAITPTSTPNDLKTLPVMFINREGEPEKIGTPIFSPAHQADVPPFSDQATANAIPVLIEQPESAAMNRLRRALFETGQLIVTPRDGVSRISFAGVGDPERLYVESTPRDEPVPVWDVEFPGCLCSLEQAEAILRRIFKGESSEKLAAHLESRSYGLRRAHEAA